MTAGAVVLPVVVDELPPVDILVTPPRRPGATSSDGGRPC